MIFQALQRIAAEHPGRAAILHYTSDGIARTTYEELTKAASRFAARFAATQEAGAIVPMYLSKSAECIAAMVGALAAGCAFACLNKKLRSPQLGALLEQARAGILLVDGPGMMSLARSSAIRPSLTNAQWWVVRNRGIHQEAAAALREKGVLVMELEEDEPLSAGSLPATAGNPDRAGCCLFTSGSTGTPKGVVVSAGDLEARAMAEARLFGLGPDAVLLSILPFSFDVGLNQLLSALTVGCTVVLLDSWLPADILKAVAKTGVTGISAVPSIWQDMMHAGMRFETEGAHRSLRYITISGGDMLPRQLERVAHLAPGCSVFKTYGQTETFRSTALRPEEFAAKRESVGRALENVRVYVLREDGTRCSPHEVGEVVHTGLGTMTGYLDEDDPQRKLRPNPFFGEGDGRPFAVFTGDLGFLDEDGYLYLKGRRDAMLKVEGNRVYPQEIARHIVDLEAIREAEVIGIRDDRGRTMLVGFVVLARGVSMSARELRRALIDRLPSYMVPSDVVALEAIPRTASGKPDLPALQHRARRLPKQPAAKT